MSFQSFVVNIALLVLIITFAVIGFLMYKGKNTFVSDNIVIGECPDYWEMVKRNNRNVCVNNKNLGKSNCSKSIDFSEPRWNKTDGGCYKYNWAKMCDLTWDGITNNPNECVKNTPNK